MNVWKFLKSVFFRTNKNWQLIVVEFVVYFIIVIVIVLGLVIPIIMIVVPAVTGGFESEDFMPLILSHLVYILFAILIFLIFLLVSLILWAFVAGGIRAILLDNILKEKRFELKTFIAYAKKFFGRIVGLWTLIGLIYTAIFIFLSGIGSLLFLFCFRFYEISKVGAILTGIFSGSIVFLIFLAAGFLLGIFTNLANTYLIVEDANVTTSMRGSFRFIKKYPGHTFLVALLLIVIAFGASFIYYIITMPLTMIPYIGSLFSLALTPISIGINLYIALFSATAYITLYLWKKEKIPLMHQ